MSYMRWPIYAWVGGDEHHPQMHLWARRDARDEGVLDPVRSARDGADAFPDFVSGVAMPLDLFDELVIRRYAEHVLKIGSPRRLSGSARRGTATWARGT